VIDKNVKRFSGQLFWKKFEKSFDFPKEIL
jgi:hypothetical protein